MYHVAEEKNRFELRGISRSIPGRGHIFRNVHLELPEAEVTALTGPSGCGKTTLAKILLRLLPPDSGVILYQGLPLAQNPGQQFRRENQMLFQNSLQAVHPRFQVQDIMAEPIRLSRFPAHDKKNLTEKMRETFSIPMTHLTRQARELSGGELRRVLLARAFAIPPRFLVLDEPFASLSESAKTDLMPIVRDLLRKNHIAALLISHNPAEINFFTDLVYDLSKFTVIGKGRGCGL